MKNPSPLRYPGGKYRFRELIAQTITSLPPPPKVLIEPFCGGSGAALSLMRDKNVESIALNDADPLVANFWMVVFGKNGDKNKNRRDLNWLIQKIETTPITLDLWKEMRASSPTSSREMAWKCLFMNRTSFNGIIHTAGPIGGWKQNLRKLDVRFNREELVLKLEFLWTLRDSVITVRNEDWMVFCNRFKNMKQAFFYMDPPYYHKADQLYKHLFSHEQHVQLQQYLLNSKKFWLLSYDDSADIRALYDNIEGVNGLVIDMKYSTHPMGGFSHIGRELFLSNQQLTMSTPAGPKHPSFDLVAPMNQWNSPAGGPMRLSLSKELV